MDAGRIGTRQSLPGTHGEPNSGSRYQVGSTLHMDPRAAAHAVTAAAATPAAQARDQLRHLCAGLAPDAALRMPNADPLTLERLCSVMASPDLTAEDRKPVRDALYTLARRTYDDAEAGPISELLDAYFSSATNEEKMALWGPGCVNTRLHQPSVNPERARVTRECLIAPLARHNEDCNVLNALLGAGSALHCTGNFTVVRLMGNGVVCAAPHEIEALSDRRLMSYAQPTYLIAPEELTPNPKGCAIS